MTERQAIQDILSKFKDTRENINKRSRSAYMDSLQPGFPVPEEGRIYGDEFKEEYREECRKYRDQLQAVIGGAADRLRVKTTDAPSTDAVNAITMFVMRDKVSPDEVQAMMQRYGDNVMCYHAINQAARKSDVFLYDDHPIEVQLQKTDDLARAVDRMFNDQISSSNPRQISAGEFSIMEVMSIDPAFPADE